MLVRLALDTGALNVSTPVGAETYAAQRELARRLLAHGLVVLADADDERALIGAIAGQPDSLKQIWELVLERLARVFAGGGPPSMKDVATTTDLAPWKDEIVLALCCKDRAQELGLGVDDQAFIDGSSGIEISRADLPHGDHALSRMVDLARTEIPAGAERASVWAERFAPLVSQARTVTILDRYAASSAFQADREGRVSGLHWLLTEIAEMPNPPKVHLISGCGSRSDSGTYKTVIRRSLKQVATERFAEIKLTLAPLAICTHARHMRFGESWAVTLDQGLTLFDSDRVGQSTPCTYGDLPAARQREREVIEVAWPKAREIVVAP